MSKRSAHLVRILLENYYTWSPYRGGKVTYIREYDPSPMVNLDIVTKIDLEVAIKMLWKRRQLTKQELQMLRYVTLDGRLSRRDISAMIQKEEGTYIDQRTISRRLESAYNKIAKELGFEYSDRRMFQIIAKKLGKPEPYILNDDEVEKIQTIWERV